MIIIASKRSKQENILKQYPDAIIADVTSQAKDGLQTLLLPQRLNSLQK